MNHVILWIHCPFLQRIVLDNKLIDEPNSIITIATKPPKQILFDEKMVSHTHKGGHAKFLFSFISRWSHSPHSPGHQQFSLEDHNYILKTKPVNGILKSLIFIQTRLTQICAKTCQIFQIWDLSVTSLGSRAQCAPPCDHDPW